MRIGFVSFWFNRGQAYVTRELRRICREAGHETFVLGRPDKLKGRFSTEGVWAEENVVKASGWDIPGDEMVAWARGRRLDVCFLFQYQMFDAVRALRDAGVVTVGTFMWENFFAEWVPDVKASLDVVYSMTAAGREHFAGYGIDAPRVHWGVWDALGGLEVEPRPADAPVTFYYPAGYLERRRAIEPTVEAFRRADPENARLLVKSTKPVPEKARSADPRIVYHSENIDRAEYLELLRSCDVCLSNTRWEGLGLVFYEAIAMGVPIICPDFPPMNENVRHGETGLVVPCRRWFRAKAPSGIPAADVSVGSLAKAIRRLADRGEVDRMSRNTLALRDTEYGWDRTRRDVLGVLELAASRGETRSQ